MHFDFRFGHYGGKGSPVKIVKAALHRRKHPRNYRQRKYEHRAVRVFRIGQIKQAQAQIGAGEGEVSYHAIEDTPALAAFPRHAGELAVSAVKHAGDYQKRVAPPYDACAAQHKAAGYAQKHAGISHLVGGKGKAFAQKGYPEAKRMVKPDIEEFLHIQSFIKRRFLFH
jgi:hypothetical protein